MIRDIRDGESADHPGDEGPSPAEDDIEGDDEVATDESAPTPRDGDADGDATELDGEEGTAFARGADGELAGPDDLASIADAEAEAEGDEEDADTLGLEAVGLESAGEGPRTRTGEDGFPERADDAATAGSSGSRRQTEPDTLEDPAEIKRVVEAVLFSLADPMSIRHLSEIVGVGVHETRQAVEDLRFEYVDTERAFRLEEIAGGVQILTRSDYDPWLRRLRQKQKESKLSAAALETLSIVAYKQPITKAELEGIRGVDCTQILKTLVDRGLVCIAGRDEGIGKALLYGTTERFLESFGLESVKELPQPEDLIAKSGGGGPSSPSRSRASADAEQDMESDLDAEPPDEAAEGEATADVGESEADDRAPAEGS